MDEAKELAKAMMSRKDAKLYRKMQFGIAAKAEEKSKLREKKKGLKKKSSESVTTS